MASDHGNVDTMKTLSPNQSADKARAVDNVSDRQNQIAAEKVRLVSQHAPAAFLVNAVMAIFVVIMDWGHVSPPVLWGWLAVVLVAVGIRAIIWFEYGRRKPPIGEAQKWGRLFAFAMACSGVSWGSAALFLFPQGAVIQQLAINITVGGLAAGAMASSATYLPLFYAYLFPALVPFIIVFLVQGTVLHVIIGLGTTIYLVAMATFGRANYQSFAELIDLRIEIGIQRDKAEQASIAKSQFLAAASHDLRQPLHALSLLTGTLGKHVHDNKDSRMVLDRIFRSVQDLENLFNALLDISKLDAQVIKPEIEDFPLQRVVKNIESDWIQISRDKGLQWEHQGDLNNVIVRSDPILLARILGNLISNAIKYTNDGKITIGAQRKNAGAEIYVSDTGPGIPEDQHQAIFQEFRQLHNPERDRAQGLGLGLAIVKRLTDLLGYTITINSEIGKGSRFAIEVPYGEPEKVIVPSTHSVKQAISGFNGLSVLVIDDEENIRSGMKSLLADWDCRVITAASSHEAISIIDEHDKRPELILADYRLRDNKTGVDAIAAIRRHIDQDIPALVITGDVAPDQLSKIDAQGFTVLHKPVSPARLRVSIQQATKNNKAQA